MYIADDVEKHPCSKVGPKTVDLLGLYPGPVGAEESAGEVEELNFGLVPHLLVELLALIVKIVA